MTHEDLTFHEVGDMGARAFAECIASRTLAIVDLRSNQIGDDGITALADGIAASCSLKTVSLWGVKGNYVYVGAAALVAAQSSRAEAGRRRVRIRTRQSK